MLSLAVGLTAAVQASDIVLQNACREGQVFPFVGLGTGGYGFDPNSTKPECWTDECGTSAKPIAEWLKMGGVRIDDANSYYHMKGTRAGIEMSGKAREDIFLLSKTGPADSLGYEDTLAQVREMNATYGTYVDALLIHWPTSGTQGTVAPSPSVDPVCQLGNATYDAKQCRLNTWKALVEVWDNGNGYARAIGVSNFNITHIEEIREAGYPLPSIIQVPFNVHRQASARAGGLFDYCRKNGILVVGYSPFGVPDTSGAGGSRGAHSYPPSVGTSEILDEPLLKQIAAKHNATPATVVVAWHHALGVPCNPRTFSTAHMRENLFFSDVSLSAEEVKQISAMPEGTCDLDPTWYECYPNKGFCPPQCCTTAPCKSDREDGLCCAGANQS